jgi:hypothetical protein
MIDVKFRRLMLQCPSAVNAVYLKPQQIEFANYVHKHHAGRVHASDAADRFATILKQLSEKGYLKRLQVKQPSGGVQYEYTPAFELLGEEQ